MKVDTMRRIDHWVGIPACLVMNLLYWFVGLFTKKKTTEPKNALFLELSEMGSAVIADPAMRKLAGEGVNLHFAIFSKNAISLRLLETIPAENVFTFCEDNLFTLVRDAFRFVIWCRVRKIDTVIDLELFSRVTSLLSGMSLASNRVGFHRVFTEGLYRGNFQTHPVAYNPHQHISHNFMALVLALLEDDYKAPYPRMAVQERDLQMTRRKCSDDELDVVIAKLKGLSPDFYSSQTRVVLINPNASDLLPQRRWMRESFAAVISSLLEQYADVLVVITGAPAEREGAQELCDMANDKRCVNSAGVFKFMELPALYTLSTTMLTNDSGPAHFSSITPLETYVIFGPETPALYSALGGNSTPIFANLACSPCVSAANHRKTSCVDNRCLQAITPEIVLSTMKATLGEAVQILADPGLAEAS